MEQTVTYCCFKLYLLSLLLGLSHNLNF